jgi:hydroxymethylbilane synthase
VERFVPAIGQGIVGIECRADDARTRSLLAPLDDVASTVRLRAERALNARLGGACQVPVAGHAVINGETLHLDALVGAPDGSRLVRDHIAGTPGEAERLGETLAERLLAAGARAILATLGIRT